VLEIPEKARLDAAHLATAVWHEMDYLLSWNCRHIVSGRVKKLLEEINATLEPVRMSFVVVAWQLKKSSCETLKKQPRMNSNGIGLMLSYLVIAQLSQ